MTFIAVLKALAAIRFYLAHASFAGAFALDALHVEDFRLAVILLYAAAFAADHIPALHRD